MRVITVGELNSYIKGLFERDSMLSNLWVKGEISNCKRAGSGHIYFTLKDNAGSVRAVMFRSRADRLLFGPENGMAVRVRGFATVYEKDGCYQLYAEEMEPEGVGSLYTAFEQLKERLQREGLFDQAIKKRIPYLPGKIGIVTSPTGSVIKDMTGIIARRFPGVEIVLAPVAVQGETAAAEIAGAIRRFNRQGEVEVIIIGRGGGSLEELWPFNTEIVARSIYSSTIPLISAVGHETDHTISDMAADLRAPTPSAAAELVVPVREELMSALDRMDRRIDRAVAAVALQCRHRLEACIKSPAFRHPVETLCGTRSLALEQITGKLKSSAGDYTRKSVDRLSVLAGRLDDLSPLATLARGYAVCTGASSGKIIMDAGELQPGERIKVKLHKGAVRCLVSGTE